MDTQTLAAWAGVAVALLASGFAAIALPFTARAANAARRQTELQREIAEEARRPVLWADIRPHPEHRAMIHLFIGNSGPTTARDVRVTVDPPLLPGAQPCSCIEAQAQARAGIASVPPGRVINWTMGVGHELLDVEDQPHEVQMRITGRDGGGVELVDEYLIRLSDIAFTSSGPGNLEDLTQEFKHFRSERKAANQHLVEALRER